MLSDGTYWYAYDPEGNRTARFIDVNANGTLDAGDTDVTEYAWDARNRLVEVTDRATHDGDPTQVVDYLYDLENRWIGRLVDADGDGQIDNQTAFAYDGNQIVLQFDRGLSQFSGTENGTVPILFGTRFAPRQPGNLRRIVGLALRFQIAHNCSHGWQEA